MCSRRLNSKLILVWPRWLGTEVVAVVAATVVVATVDEVAVAVVAATEVSKNLSTNPNVIAGTRLTWNRRR